ncbi:type I-C CRISPR-associated protein Cas7/Csd2 [soil metagenome]
MNNRYDFIYLFDIKNGNPNGDPDAGNAPRIDAETGNGLVTDVCLKRKIRNYICLTQNKPDGSPDQGYDIYVKERAILNEQHLRAYTALGLPPDDKDRTKATENENKARKWMCQTFFDVRMFGAVMSTGVNCGQVRGPVQLTFATSQSPIFHISNSITRMAVTTERESVEQSGGNRTMGSKEIIPYGLYRSHGFINASLAEQTGFSDKDLELLWTSLRGMFDNDRSASRGEMAARELLIFKHDSKLGSQQAHRLFEKLVITLKDSGKPPRDASDYRITFDGKPLDEVVKPGESKDLGNGITLIRRI